MSEIGLDLDLIELKDEKEETKKIVLEDEVENPVERIGQFNLQKIQKADLNDLLEILNYKKKRASVAEHAQPKAPQKTEGKAYEGKHSNKFRENIFYLEKYRLGHFPILIQSVLGFFLAIFYVNHLLI